VSERGVAIVLAISLGALLAGCAGSREPTLSGGDPESVTMTSETLISPASSSATSASRTPSTSVPSSSRPAPSASPIAPPPAPPVTAATPAPAWLGTRALGPAGGGPVPPQVTPAELVDRRIITRDLLPRPADLTFRPQVVAVPDDVLARSTWQPACPVAVADLRYVTVQFWGFDEVLHTGELLLNADGVDAVVAAFAAMHAERFPLEEVRVIRADELDVPPTGDGNVTSAFVCRPVTGGTRWSDHAYGRAIDVNPFHNPYEKGTGSERVVIPELSTAYTDRNRRLPGMITSDSAVAVAFANAGWGWGGDYRTLKDFQHFSASGG